MARSLLHCGCGGDLLPDWAKNYDETRLDIDAAQNPDIVADMTAMGEIGMFDAVYSCHALEHLTAKDAVTALKEFRRVLNDGGFAMVVVPDLEDVKATDEVILESPAGPITGLDMIYGWQKSENPFMAHKTGFVKETLEKAFNEAGYSKVYVNRLTNFNLIGVGVR